MGYFNVTNASPNATDGLDIAITKSINMNDWQMNLTKSLQKADPNGKVTTLSSGTNEEHQEMMMDGGGGEMPMGREQKEDSSQLANVSNSTHVSIVNGATTLGDKSFSPNHIKVKVGSSIIWTNDDSTIHTVTSGAPNTPDAGQVFDSGLTSLISPSKTYSHKFTICRRIFLLLQITPYYGRGNRGSTMSAQLNSLFQQYCLRLEYCLILVLDISKQYKCSSKSSKSIWRGPSCNYVTT